MIEPNGPILNHFGLLHFPTGSSEYPSPIAMRRAKLRWHWPARNILVPCFDWKAFPISLPSPPIRARSNRIIKATILRGLETISGSTAPSIWSIKREEKKRSISTRYTSSLFCNQLLLLNYDFDLCAIFFFFFDLVRRSSSRSKQLDLGF